MDPAEYSRWKHQQQTRDNINSGPANDPEDGLAITDSDSDTDHGNLLDVPRYHRPPSLSIVTIGTANVLIHSTQSDIEEVLESDEDERIAEEYLNKVWTKQSNASNVTFNGESAEKDNDKGNDAGGDQLRPRSNSKSSSSIKSKSSNRSEADLKVRQIVYGQNDPEDDPVEVEDGVQQVSNQVHSGRMFINNNNNKNRSRQEVILEPNDLEVLSVTKTYEKMGPVNLSNIEYRRLQRLQRQQHGTTTNNSNRQADSISLAQSVQSYGNKSILKIPTSVSPPPVEADGSIGECSMQSSGERTETPEHSKENQEQLNKMMNTRLVKLLSIMYGSLVVIFGAVITMGGMNQAVNDYDHLYNIVVTTITVCFLIFLHFDVQRHKRFVLQWQKKRKEIIESPLVLELGMDRECDTVSVTTAVIFNRVVDNIKSDDNLDDETRTSLNGYKFITGKHSGSFYLKIGMTLFCMGSIVHQGMNLAYQVHYFTIGADECKNEISLVVYLLRCISAFYQLYIAFRYSNLIVNRHHYLVRFGLMHMVGQSISFWFSTIIEEAVHGYMEKLMHGNHSDGVFLENAFHHHQICANKTLHDFESIDAMPFFYPFSIEYNIILASVWYIIWSNVENDDPHSVMHNLREEINEDRKSGAVDIVYRSNIFISADCHASNLGMFGGLFSLLLTLITIILFFTTIKHSQYNTFGIAVYTAQSLFLTLCCLMAVSLAFRHTRKLDVSKHLDSSQTAMDDFLLMIPLPFYFIHHILCIYSELLFFSYNSIAMAICYAMNLIQVTIQTPFIIDGIRRCSNHRKHRYKKPGKQLITFAIIINVTLWILVTFEIKSVDKYHSMPDRFGTFLWMVILDTCLPLMLFYRFHSSVCLSDMWKHCYEKDDH